MCGHFKTNHLLAEFPFLRFFSFLVLLFLSSYTHWEVSGNGVWMTHYSLISTAPQIRLYSRLIHSVMLKFH